MNYEKLLDHLSKKGYQMTEVEVLEYEPLVTDYLEGMTYEELEEKAIEEGLDFNLSEILFDYYESLS